MAFQVGLKLEQTFRDLPFRYPGPGGGAAVICKGQVIVADTWGWADVERRVPFSPRSLFRLCSLTKHLTCGVVLSACPDLSVLDDAVHAWFPQLQQEPPRALHLCHNMSGLRDMWAVAMLHGAVAEAKFSEAEARVLINKTRTLQFVPGSRFSYANQNFRILSDAVQEVSGKEYSELLQSHIFDPAGMIHARYAPDTSSMPDGSRGYEGDVQSGFRAAENASIWTGDGGVVACLDDMIAWERFIDATREDAHSLYNRLSAPVPTSDGEAGAYGFGLNRWSEYGRLISGHAGSIRGWRIHRIHCQSERISVVVMFNHMAEPHVAALDLFAAVLGEDRPASTPMLLRPSWLGSYSDKDKGLAVRVDVAAGGKLRLRYGQSAQMLALHADGTASNAHTRLRFGDGGLWMDRPNEKRSVLLERCAKPRTDGIAGRYHCSDLTSDLSVAETSGVLYAAFSGFLGAGQMELLDPVGGDTWTLPTPRGLDFAPPGDWTLIFRRDEGGKIYGVDVGCWRARGLNYMRVS